MLSDSLRGHVAFLDTLLINSNSLTGRQRKVLLSHDGELKPVTSCLKNPHSKYLEKLMSEYESESMHRTFAFVKFR